MKNKLLMLCLIAIIILFLVASILDAYAYSTEDWVCEKVYEENMTIAADNDNLPFITFYIGMEDDGYSFADVITRDNDEMTIIYYTVKPELLDNSLNYINIKNTTDTIAHDVWMRYSSMIKYYPHSVMIYNEAYYNGNWHIWGE